MSPDMCPGREQHGNPFRYCPVKGCGWMESPSVEAQEDGW